MNKRIAQWKIDGGDTPYFHPLANMDAVHFITVFAMKMGIGGTLCHEWQGMVAPK